MSRKDTDITALMITGASGTVQVLNINRLKSYNPHEALIIEYIKQVSNCVYAVCNRYSYGS